MKRSRSLPSEFLSATVGVIGLLTMSAWMPYWLDFCQWAASIVTNYL